MNSNKTKILSPFVRNKFLIFAGWAVFFHLTTNAQALPDPLPSPRQSSGYLPGIIGERYYANPQSGLFAMDYNLLINADKYFNHNADDANQEWQFTAVPYLFLTGITGEAAIGLVGPTEVAVDFGDLLQALEAAYMFHGEVQKGSWGMMLDLIFARIGDDISTPMDGILDIEVELLILEMFISHRILKNWGHIDVYAGIRLWDVDLDLDLDGEQFRGAVSKGDSWADPVVGGRVRYNLSDKWFAMLNTDFGGFGVSADFSWNIQPSIGYSFTKTFSLVGQYKYLTVDFESGEVGTRDFFAFDVKIKGPLIGLAFQF